MDGGSGRGAPGNTSEDHKGVTAVVARWDDLVRYLALHLTADLGQQVKQTLPKNEQRPDERRQALVDSLSSKSQLYAELAIPDAGGSL